MKLDRIVWVNGLLAAAALGSAIWVVADLAEPSAAEVEARRDHLVTDLVREEIDRIEIRGQGPPVVLERSEPGDAGEASYRLVQPKQREADQESVSRWARALESARFLRLFEVEKAGRPALGLDAPRREIRLAWAKHEVSIRVGKPAKTPQGTTYVEVREGGSARAGLVKDSVLDALFVVAADLRPRSIVPHGLSEITRIDLSPEAGASLTLRRGRGPAWLEASGRRIRREAVESLVDDLASTQAKLWLSPGDPPAKQGGTLISLRLRGQKEPYRIRFAGTCPGHEEWTVASGGATAPDAACVDRTILRRLEGLAGKLLDPGPFALRADEVDTLSIQRQERKLELARTERGFELRAPEHAEVPLDLGNERLEAVLEARGEAVPDPDLPALGLSPPLGKVVLGSSAVDEGQRFEETLELGREKPDGRLPVRRPEDGVVLLLSRDAGRALEADRTLLRKASLFDFSPSDVEHLEIRSGGEHEVLRRASAGGFELTQPPGFSVDAGRALELVQALGTLEAKRWVADRDDGSFGLSDPEAVVTLELRPEDAGVQRHLLTLGRSTARGSLASLDTEPGVFVLERSVATAITTLLVSRAALLVDLDSLRTIEIKTPTRAVVLTRNGDGFQAASGASDAGLDAATAQALAEAAADLEAEAALHTGPPLPAEGFARPALSIELSPLPGEGAPRTLRVGAGDSWREMRVFYVRRDDRNATYVVAQSRVRRLLDAL